VPDRIYNVLFICTGNRARSIIAEAVLNYRGKGKFRAYSSGSHPRGEVHPIVLKLLENNGMPTAELRSKSWDEFAEAGAPAMDFIFTVCDQAAGEVCPVWPGTPMTAHWGVADPDASSAAEVERKIWQAYRELETRILLFTSLRLEELDRMSLKNRLDEIGQTRSSS
jgi:arsenate reductase (thioredoxin)